MRPPTLTGLVCGVALALALGGCGTVGRIVSGGTKVTGVTDAGKPATLTSGEVRTGFRVPAKSRLTITRTDATQTSPAVEVSTWDFSEPTQFEQQASTILANTGTVDTSVRKHQIDAAERRWLLFAAIGCAIAGLVVHSLIPAWPGLSNGLLVASPLAFAAWKFAEIPAWLWAVAVLVMAVLALGYKRAEWDANKDFIPDILQKK